MTTERSETLDKTGTRGRLRIVHHLIPIGRWLFRYRALSAAICYAVLFLLARPGGISWIMWALVVAGLALRFWASGYVGKEARGNVVSASQRVTGGPYGLFRHPLYVGNLLLVLGIVQLYHPLTVIHLMIMLLFVVQYGLIILAEEDHLRDCPSTAGRFVIARTGGEVSTLAAVVTAIVLYAIRIRI